MGGWRSPTSGRARDTGFPCTRSAHDHHLAPVRERGGIQAEGVLEGFVRLETVTCDIAEALQGVEVEAAGIFQTTLQNGNPVIQPAVTLLDAVLIERTGGDFMFYEEGVTEAVGRVMQAVDDERLAIAQALGVAIVAEPDLGVRQGYMIEPSYSTGYSTALGFRGIKAQNELHHRYLTEGVGYSMVVLTDLARHVSVSALTMDAVIGIASVVAGEDFAAEHARTMGLSGLTREQLAAL